MRKVIHDIENRKTNHIPVYTRVTARMKVQETRNTPQKT